MENLEKQAIAELDSILNGGEGTLENPETDVETPETVASKEVETTEAQEETKESSDETATSDEQEDLQKQIDEKLNERERELKKKYLSQVSKKDKELKDLQAKLEEIKSTKPQEEFEAIEKIVENKLLEKEKARIEEKEKNSLFKNNPNLETHRTEIEAIKADYPTMSWDAARRFYFSLQADDVASSSNSVSVNKLDWIDNGVVIKPKETMEDLLKQAEKEYRSFI